MGLPEEGGIGRGNVLCIRNVLAGGFLWVFYEQFLDSRGLYRFNVGRLVCRLVGNYVVASG